MPNKSARPFSGVRNLKCIAAIGDSNLVQVAAASRYITLIGASRNFSSVVNAGVSGQGATQMVARFDRDILAHRPGAIYINCGTNDATGAVTQTWEDNMRSMVNRGVDSGALVTLGTPVIVRNPPGDRPFLADYVTVIREIAGDTTGCVLFDLYERFLTYSEANLNSIYEVDGVHINVTGNQWVADMANEAANLDCFKIRV